tara:strand:- start:680 stop:1030 length:351 start_codon:yes stop_codon:yes gene_type:complete
MKKFLEADVTDSQGEIVISPGLKVRHKESQFEYTVDNVVDDGGEINIVLKMPESPRVEPDKPDPEMLDSTSTMNKSNREQVYEVDPEGFYLEPEDPGSEDLMVVPQEEFEAEYEVK